MYSATCNTSTIEVHEDDRLLLPMFIESAKCVFPLHWKTAFIHIDMFNGLETESFLSIGSHCI
jgi:glycerol-3-phosphate responsive antiterminator